MAGTIYRIYRDYLKKEQAQIERGRQVTGTCNHAYKNMVHPSVQKKEDDTLWM